MPPPSRALDNVALLGQAAGLLERLTDHTYATSPHPASPASVGAHVRHVLDHYEAFLSGWAHGRIDYDARERDALTETDRTRAQSVILRTRKRLQDLPGEVSHREVQVCAATDPGETAAPAWVASTVGRELAFLVSHTVHHFALMAMVARLHGVEPEPAFGYAPSTLRHLASHVACAR